MRACTACLPAFYCLPHQIVVYAWPDRYCLLLPDSLECDVCMACLLLPACSVMRVWLRLPASLLLPACLHASGRLLYGLPVTACLPACLPLPATASPLSTACRSYLPCLIVYLPASCWFPPPDLACYCLLLPPHPADLPQLP